MKLLVQTSSAAFGLGLMSASGDLLHEIHAEDKSTRSKNLGDLFRSLTETAGCTLSDITEICVDIGPGGLSSTRAGVSFANALAFAGSAQLWGVSALDLLMLAAREGTERPVCSLRPAQGGLAFWAFYSDAEMQSFGCDRPDVVIRELAETHGEIALAGPLPRLKLDPAALPGVQLLDIDPPGLGHFAKATRRAPTRLGGIGILEPITAPEGLAEK